ncbi:carbamate kinase [Arthrobacter glacialis]|uniref:amino acid kinase family protein n=1 Tax=Arthrobacter glacialis TaxID=1664 RepID=UPI000CD4037F|nr:carbamate kinase [Arthrobacter glacialis]POH57801.1 carbamate kinase [Arthrobacter glacialis]
MRLVVAIGGNALLHLGEIPDAKTQVARLALAAPALVALAAEHEVVIVHGNGPQVGLLAMQTGDDSSLTSPYPLWDLVAESQGLIGYWLQEALGHAGLAKDVVVLVSRTLVDPTDPRLLVPTKFVGSLYDESGAHALARKHDWTVAADGSGWRRVVPSPLPIRILESAQAMLLLDAGATVVLAGGGGVPVVPDGPGFRGIEGIVDKDYVAARVAVDIDAQMLVILTDVQGVMSNFGTPSEELLKTLKIQDIEGNCFPDGSIGPKVRAAADFVTASGGRALIGSLDNLGAIMDGKSGTEILGPGTTSS